MYASGGKIDTNFEYRADLVVTLGAGSISDAVKTAVLCVANDVHSYGDMEKLVGKYGMNFMPFFCGVFM